MQFYSDRVTDQYGNVKASASVSVLLNGLPATIYSDDGVTTQANPITTASDGSFSFYAANGTYTLSVSDAESQTVTLLDYTEAATATPTSSSTVLGETGGVVKRFAKDSLGPFVNVKDPQFGATGDGTTDDTTAIQAAIDSISASGGVVLFPRGTYRVARNVGTNDRWGVKVPHSNVKLLGDQATLRRYNTDISTYSLAYPLVFVGTPDSNAADPTENVVIEGLHFHGEDTRHSTSGNAVHDFREAIEAKNTKNLVVRGNRFTLIDSAVITYQKPADYDYANSAYYNTTKNYNAKFIGNTCVAESHAVNGRALIHAVVAQGVDNLLVDGNYFAWCDDVLAGEGTYDDLNDAETDTYTPDHVGWSLGAVKRCGRGWAITNNTIYNSSEHALYPAGMDVTITGNNIHTDNITVCAYEPVKIRSRNTTVTGNTISGYGVAVFVCVPAFNVTVTGNTIYSNTRSAEPDAAINVSSDGLSAYIDARNWLGSYYPVHNVTVSGNSITFPAAAVSGLKNIGVVVYSDSVDANYPEGQLVNVTISGNTIRNHRIGLYVVGTKINNVAFTDNVLDAKPFTSAAFASGTTLDTYAAVMIHSAATSVGFGMKVSGNTINGTEYVFATHDGGGSSVHLPWGIQGNKLFYVKNFKTADMRPPAPFNAFFGNTGYFFLDRTGWVGDGVLGNGLHDGSAANSAYKYSIVYNGANVLFYKDDSATTVTLG